MSSPLNGKTITPEFRQEWLKERQKKLGASEIATAIGINSYDSMLRLWLTKTGKLPPKTATPEMEMGNLMEPLILKLYEHKTGNKIMQIQVFCVSCTHNYLCATLDGITYDHINVQVKNVGCQSALYWGPDGTDEVPHDVIVQAQQEMFCSGLELTQVVSLIGGNDLRVYNITRDDMIIAHLIKKGHEFLERVRQEIYPVPDPARDQDLVKYLFPGCDGALELDEIQSADVLKWDQVHRELKLLEKEEKQLKMKLILGMGEASQAQLNNGMTLYRSITSVPASTREVKGYSFPVFKLKGEPHKSGTDHLS